MESIIDIKDVSVEFRNYHIGNLTLKNKIYRLLIGQKIPSFKALDGINIKINSNESIGIIGRNGAGKSTLLRVIAGIIVPSKGTAKIKKRTTSILELGTGFHPELSGRENCQLAGSLMGLRLKEIDKKIEGIIEYSGIGAFIDNPVKTYSSGMFARLAFALAISVEPEILIIDEILSVGDEFFQRKCIKTIHDLMKKGVTTIMVSHNLDFLQTQCKRLIWIDHGKVIMDGNPKEIAQRYRNNSNDDSV
jgi:teichoic acid transport system ATP-binding protein